MIRGYSPATQQATTLASGLGAPTGLALDSQGNVYFTEQTTNDVKKLVPATAGPSTKTEPALAGSDTLSFMPATVPVTASSDQPWLTIGAAAQGQITFSFSTNPSSSSRVAHISAIGQQFTITQQPLSSGTLVKLAGDNQSAGLGQRFLTPLEVQLLTANGAPIPGEQVSFQVMAATASATFTGPTTVTTDASGTATAPLLTANSVAGQFNVIATAGTLSISFQLTDTTQTFTLASSSLTEGSGAGSDSVLLTVSPNNATWGVSSTVPWMPLRGVGIGSGSVPFSFSANTTPAPRTGTINIAGQTLTVTQAAANAMPFTSFSRVPIPFTMSGAVTLAVDLQGNVYFTQAAQVSGSTVASVNMWNPATQQVTP